jgi:1-phosphatidylinositol phosphodiesterase
MMRATMSASESQFPSTRAASTDLWRLIGNRTNSLLLSGLLCLCLAGSSAAAQSNARWMGLLRDDTSLSELSIPGTHDAGARHERWYGTIKCQTLTIPEQLQAGVRFLDIRCRHVKNTFLIYHGPVYQRLSFNGVLDACGAFLRENPTECVIMSVKEENTPSADTRSFEDTFDACVAGNPVPWWLADNIPTLSQVRGKVVLFRRFKARAVPKGIDASAWPDDSSFTISNPAARLRVQDCYKVRDNRLKWKAIQALYEEAASGDRDCLYVNFASGYTPSWFFRISRIRAVSGVINPQIDAYFGNRGAQRCGITLMDFADDRKCSLIIATNQQKEKP